MDEEHRGNNYKSEMDKTVNNNAVSYFTFKGILKNDDFLF